MEKNTSLLLTGPVGQLEAMAYAPAIAPCGIALIAHPHPLHGGAMRNKVVTTLARLCRDLGFIAYTFNFRGVGLSEGHYAEGMGEQDDLTAVIAWARQQHPHLPLWLAGFSFGAYVSAKVAPTVEPDCLISICPPVYHFDYEPIQPPSCPWFIVQTDDDEVVDADKVKTWITTLNPKPTLIGLTHGGHFFHGQLLVLRDKLSAALITQFPNLCLTH